MYAVMTGTNDKYFTMQEFGTAASASDKGENLKGVRTKRTLDLDSAHQNTYG